MSAKQGSGKRERLTEKISDWTYDNLFISVAIVVGLYAIYLRAHWRLVKALAADDSKTKDTGHD
jgi:hypothetical protein